MLFWNLFIQTLVIVYVIMFVGAGLSWWARSRKSNAETEIAGGNNGS